MAFPPRWRTISGGSGNIDTIVTGTTTGGSALATNGIELGTLSCLFTVEAETTSLTFTAKFQVSDDDSTWYDLAGDAQNPANVTLATGTGGDDAVITRVLPVPTPVAGWKYVRAAVVSAGATGAATDTYAFSFRMRYTNGF